MRKQTNAKIARGGRHADVFHRRGLEGAVSEWEGKFRAQSLELLEACEDLAKVRAKATELSESNALLFEECTAMAKLKAYSGDLQSRLRYSERQLGAERERLVRRGTEVAALQRQLAEATARAERAESRASAAEARNEDLEGGVSNLSSAKAQAEQAFGAEKGSLSEALMKALNRVEMLEGERDELQAENAKLVSAQLYGSGGRPGGGRMSWPR